MKIDHCSWPLLSISYLIINLFTPQKCNFFQEYYNKVKSFVETWVRYVHLTGCCMMFGNEPVGCISYCQTGWAPRRSLQAAALAWDATPGKVPAVSVQGLSTTLCSWVASPACTTVSCHLPPPTASAATAITGVERQLQEATAGRRARFPSSPTVAKVCSPWRRGDLGHEIPALTGGTALLKALCSRKAFRHHHARYHHQRPQSEITSGLHHQYTTPHAYSSAEESNFSVL